MDKLKYNPEKPLKSAFPEKKEFFESRDKYVKDNFQASVDTLKKFYPGESDEIISYAAIAIARALHAATVFIDSTPGHLWEGNYKLTAGWSGLENVTVGGSSNAFFKVDDKEHISIIDLEPSQFEKAFVSELYAVVNANRVMHKLNFAIKFKKSSLETIEKIEDPEEKKEMEDIVNEDFLEKLERLFQQTETDMVHELGHALDHLHINKNKNRIQVWKAQVNYGLYADPQEKFGKIPDGKYDQYRDSKPEKRARIWENYFRKRFYT